MPMRLNRPLAVAVISLVACAVCRAAPAAKDGPGADLVQASLLADVDAASPGGSFTLGVRMKVKPHWHTYWVNPGESGEATKVTLTGPAGFEFGEIQWPLPHKIDAPGGITYGYEDEVLLLIPVTVAKDVSVSGQATIEADVSWLVCKDECIQGGDKLSISLPVSASANPANRELFETWRQRLPMPKDHAEAAKALATVQQPAGSGGAPAPALDVEWKAEPRKVEWFPVSTRAVAVENVTVRHEGRRTKIAFKPTVYQAEDVPGGRVDGVLVYEDAAGVRRGVPAPVTVSLSKAE